MMINSRSAVDISVGDILPELQVVMTAQKIISAAAATRDWQPIHHDHTVATASGLRGIILNAPSQTGWISKYITDWAGPHAQIKRLSFKMKDSICPGDALCLNGEIISKDNDGLVVAAVTLAVGEKIKTVAEVRFSFTESN
jgi:acyl dehydratase